MKNEIQSVVPSKYIDLTTDFGFRRLFSCEPNKELLINFLNALLAGKKCIVDLTFNKNEYRGPVKSSRGSVFDLTCTGQDGEQFIIEIQRATQRFFKDRAVYYTSTLIQEQGQKGQKGQKEWNFYLREIYLIGLMEFCFQDSEPEDFVHRAHLTHERTGKTFYEKLGYIFIELPKFTKQENELRSDLDRWLFHTGQSPVVRKAKRPKCTDIIGIPERYYFPRNTFPESN